MKVLVCAYSCLKDPDERFGNGGESFLGWELVRQIGKYSETHVLTYYKNRPTIEERMLNESNDKIKFYFISLPIFFNFLQKIHGGVQIYAYLWQIKAYFFAKKLNKEVKFNIFHHITYANDWMASYIGAFLKIPYVRGPGGGAHKVPKIFLKDFSFKERVLNKLRDIGQWFFRHDPVFLIGQGRAKALLVCNNESFQAMPKKWKGKTSFFPVNGVSKKDLLLLGEKVPNNNFCVITAGKLLKIKNFDMALRAFKEFALEKENVSFIIVGDGPEHDNLFNLAKELKIFDKVIIEKWMPRDELLRKVSNADVFIFPSLRDGGGAVVVEAMAMALPVICFNIAGPGFHIDENCGIKIEPNYPGLAIRYMADAIQKLYYDDDLRLRLGLNAREKAETQYSWDVLGEKLQKIYKK